jgi:hypothetical protein
MAEKNERQQKNNAESKEAHALASRRRNDARQLPKTHAHVSFVFFRFFRLSIVGGKPQLDSVARAHINSHCLNQRETRRQQN